MFLLRECWRRIVASIRHRFREIRDCRPCYKIGLDTPGPPGPDDVITANDRWRSPPSGAPLTDVRAAKEAFKKANADPNNDEPLDLREVH